MHGSALGTESTSFGKNHGVVKAIRYQPLGHFALPTYYQDEQGTLVLRSFYFHAKALYGLEFKGVRFAYTALAEGEGLGVAGPVYWLGRTATEYSSAFIGVLTKGLKFPSGRSGTGNKAATVICCQ